MTSNEIKKRKREEYEMQLFGFHSSIVFATLKSMIEEQTRKRVAKLFDFIEQKSKPTGHDAERLLRDKKKLTKAYYQSIRDHLPAIENCINKVVNIPQHVLLEEDVVQSTQYSEKEYLDADNKLKELQLRLKQAMMLNGALKDELDAANDFEDSIEVANTLCDIVQAGSKYPEVSRDLVELMQHFKDLKKYGIVRNEPDLNHKNVCRKHLPVDVDTSRLEFD